MVMMMMDVGCTDEMPRFGTRNWHNLSDIHGTKFVKIGLAVEAGFNVHYSNSVRSQPLNRFPFLFCKKVLSTVMYVLVCTDFEIYFPRKGAQNLVF